MSKRRGNYERPRSGPHPVFLLLLLWLGVLFPELLLHFCTQADNVFSLHMHLIYPILFSLVPVLILWTLILCIRFRFLRILISILETLVPVLLCASQLVYYKIFGCFYSVFSMMNGGAALQFGSIIGSGISKCLIPLILMTIPLFLICIFAEKNFRLPNKFSLWQLSPLAIAVILQVSLVLSLPLFGKQPMTPYDLYHNTADSYYSVQRLGLTTAFRLDLTRFLTGTENSGSIQLDVPTEPPESTVVPETMATTPKTIPPQQDIMESTTPTEPPVDTSPNVLDIDFDKLIQTAPNTQIQEVHQYFNSRTPSSKNEKTGIFSGCNLILITAEAFHAGVVTEERTPTLYKMMTEGFYFTDYYVPDWGTSTTDGEYSFLTGTIPKANTWSFSNSSKNAMPLTMAQQLINLGYNAFAYHGHTYDYYDRNEYLENLGYTFRAYKQNLPVDYTWPESDVQVVDLTTDDYASKEPFTAYYMTISGHREFNFYGNFIAAKNKALTENEPYSEPVRAYIATQLELEMSLQLLMERLEEAGTLDNTVFVLTADHYPNGLTNEELSELVGHDIETNFELYKNGCIIYKPGMTPETISTPCSHLDLLPTLSNLFGLEFDSRLYMGRDVFSDAQPLVMFRNRSWITDVGSYNFNTGKSTSNSGHTMADSYVQKINTEVSNRFTVSSRILDYDYWRIIFPE